MPNPSESSYIRNRKKEAKLLKKSTDITHAQALDQVSQNYGFPNWKSFISFIRDCEQNNKPLPISGVSQSFIADPEIALDENDLFAAEANEAREIPSEIKQRIRNGIKSLTKVGLEFSLFEPTVTGLKKSILDATKPVRTHFEIQEFHHYELQQQGPEHKIKKEAFFVDDLSITETSMSLYRPNTKSGDPRMWFKGLGKFAEAGDQIAILIFENQAFLINLSKTDLELSLNNSSSEIYQLLNEIKLEATEVLNELLSKLKILAQKPLKSLRKGDTGVGYTLETHLGIEANSSKKPDYKGIELKSGRGGTRTTLFAQVPDWQLSTCKKSSEILDSYGYERGNDFKLYCTISTQRENSQGLKFIYDQANDQVVEVDTNNNEVAVWTGNQLRKRLREKHAETLWIQANSIEINGEEYFQLNSAIHTKAPILNQLMPLIGAGIITMDHLIKRSGETGKVSEKGPLFKINKTDLDMLFPTPEIHKLL
jgi:hypothetical protein